MFEDVKRLSDLNAERKRLVMAGHPVTEVNAAYNKARRALMETTPKVRRPPTFTGEAAPRTTYTPCPLSMGKVPKNVIQVVSGTVNF